MRNRYHRHACRRISESQETEEILDLIPGLPWQLEERVLITVSCKLGSKGKPLFDIDELNGQGRWDRVRSAIKLGVAAKGPRLTTQAVRFAVQTALY